MNGRAGWPVAHARPKKERAGRRPLVVVGLAVLLLATGCPKPKKCEVEYTVASHWSGGFVAEIVVRNLQKTVAFDGWTLRFATPGGATVEDVWNAAVVSSGEDLALRNRGYNARIEPREAVYLGFRAAVDGEAILPDAFTLNGHACKVAGNATPGTSPTPAPPSTPTPAAPTPAQTATATPVATPTPPANGPGVRLTFARTEDWGSGYTAQIVATNVGTSTISGWQLRFDLEDRITTLWNGIVSSPSPGRWAVANEHWNGTIAPGASVDVGFNADVASPGASPSGCVFNGSPCSFELDAATPTPPGPGATPTPAPTATGGPATTPTPAPTPEPTPTAAPTPSSPTGAELYVLHRCHVCHGADGSGGGAPGLLHWTDEVALTAKIDADMPRGNPAACTGECASKIALYILDELIGVTIPIECDAATLRPRGLRLLTRREYVETVRDLLGLEASGALVGLPVEIRVRGYDNNAAVAGVTSRHVDAYLAEAEALAVRVVAERKGALVPCDPSSGALACARTFIEELGARAYRRPLEATEVDRLLAFFADDPALFDVGLHDAVWAMLVSPHFLYRSEVGSLAPDGSYALDGFEIASALSYLLWGTMPDAPLFAAAESGALDSAEGRREQAERLLADPRARRQLGRFASQWLGADPLLAGEKSTTAFPTFDPAVQEAQFRELEEFVARVTFDSTGAFEELFEPGYVMADPVLAAYYGLPIPAGGGFAPVPVADGSRGGVLTLGSVLSAHAHSDDGSPVRRGVFVRRRVLCQDLPPPPPDVDNTPPGLDPSLTTRERFALHSSNAACQTCHQFIDGVGFGFENFDGAGGRRETENGVPVDASGQIVGLESLQDTASVIPFEGTEELSAWIAGSEAAPRCLALQLYRWSTGAEETAQDACEIDALAARFSESDFDLRELLLTVIELPSFTARRGG